MNPPTVDSPGGGEPPEEYDPKRYEPHPIVTLGGALIAIGVMVIAICAFPFAIILVVFGVILLSSVKPRKTKLPPPPWSFNPKTGRVEAVIPRRRPTPKGGPRT